MNYEDLRTGQTGSLTLRQMVALSACRFGVMFDTWTRPWSYHARDVGNGVGIELICRLSLALFVLIVP